ncbi:hypothetical protein OLX02_03960 [Novosphingobium sp. KCTC 2891]|uniref:hypothetical protein n=1 Tax=Novosphingobium sp. KCTC 2891 TaxID=2989730 RepID=UPI002223DA32|nr:hypothetical protein [Novosphingobium sp. KCTC 2891]MCW1381970.1 hypothetical protein [Novosphingobium sp. KCTC 2891]
MPHVFMVTSAALPTPVIIVARDSDEALRNFWIWRECSAGKLGTMSAIVTRFTADDLARVPQLADAARSGMAGIARWVGHREGWIVTTPDDDEPAGQVAPPKTEISCFVFSHADDGTLHVFAETMERAIATLHLYNLDQNGWDADYDDVVELSPWLLTGSMVTLREEMFDGITGVGMRCEDGFWRIFPADYTPPLRKRDGSVR